MSFFDLLRPNNSSKETNFSVYREVKPKILHWEPFLDTAIEIGCIRKHLTKGWFNEPHPVN